MDTTTNTPDMSLPTPAVLPLMAPESNSKDQTLTPSQLADLRYREALATSVELDIAKKQRDAALTAASDQDNRTYMFFAGTSNDEIESAIRELNLLSRRFPGEPLTIVLCSPGGSVVHGLALYDHIRSLSAKGHYMTVVVRGMAASMGGIVLQAGDKRVIGAESEVLIHAVSSGTQGPLYTMLDTVERIERLWTKLVTILASRSTMTPRQIKQKAARSDWWVDAKMALELDFADEIG